MVTKIDDGLERRRRKSVRLQGYDYSQEGAYFITICTHNRRCTLCDIIENRIVLSEWGRIVEREWHRSGAVRAEIGLDAFVIMPNHIHGIIFIHPVGASGGSPNGKNPGRRSKSIPPGFAKKSLASFIAGFKSTVTIQINELRQERGKPFWQRNYYEHVIRDEKSLFECRTYIEQNPLKWVIDKENPKCELLM